jgi:hypothetical protein
LERLNIPLLELGLNEFERFDFKTDANIYIDFKLWHTQNKQEADELIDKIRKKMKEVKAEKVYIINILGSLDTVFRPIPSDEGKIVELPYLCKNDQVDSQAIKFIMEEF